MSSGGRPVPGCLAQGGHAGQEGEEPALRLSQGNSRVESSYHHAESGNTDTS